MNFYATLEYTNPGEAIVALFDEAGEWCGAGRVECRSGRRDDLYEEGYKIASLSARSKSGRLVRYRVVDPEPLKPEPESEHCPSRLYPELPRRPGNCLCVEVGQPATRCVNKHPTHWPKIPGLGLRWLASGGESTIFGICTNCKRRK